MSEGTAGARRMSWLCLAKPLIILSYDSHPLANEQKLMAALETGGQPAVTLGKKECRENEARYQDMLKLLLRREVVLTPYAYEPPEGFRGNVFRRPEGSLVVTLVREPSAAVPPMVEPAVRPPKDAHVQAVYEVSPEAKGLRQVGFTSEQGAVRWRVASPRNASMFLLAVSGRFLSTSQRVILPDSKTEARTRLENLCDEPWSTEVCVGEDRKTITVPAMSRLDVSFPVAAQAEGGAVRASLTGSSNRLIGPPVIEIPARPALDVWPVVADPQESANSTARVVFGVLNRTSEVLEPALEVQVEGGEATASPPRLDGGEAAEVVVTAGKLAPGAHRVSLQVSALGTESRAECIIRVTRTHFPNAEALRGARSLTVTMDLFNSLGNQYADKPVRVNGVEVGKLPVTGQTLQWHNDLSLTVKGPLLRQLVEKAIEADGASATFRVTVGNGVRNCFKVRRCRLSFGLADGTIVASAPDPFVRCSDMNWLYAEGKPVRMGEPVELGIFRCSIGSNRR
jgi:hypothetical protein